jgi:hypothetical protein
MSYGVGPHETATRLYATTWATPLGTALTLTGAVLALTLTGATASHRAGIVAGRPHPAAAYGRLPLAFEPNRGQTNRRVRFIAHAPGSGVFLTSAGAVLALQGTGAGAPRGVIRLGLMGARRGAALAGLDRLPGTVNYLRGRDPSRWRTAIPTFARVRYAHAWPGVDVDFHGNATRLEYDFRVARGADTHRIALAFGGARSLRVTAAGDLLIGLVHGDLLQRRPVAYQWQGSRRLPVSADYVIGAGGRVTLRLGAYDRRRPLVVDPGLVYSTYLGGSGAYGAYRIAVDSSGATYITGNESSTNFPATGGAYQASSGGGYDAFVSKLNAAGTALVYSTYLGGSGTENGLGVALDRSGNAYVTGNTDSTNFPTTSAALETSSAGGLKAFVTKLGPTGNAVYSTYLGGTGTEGGDGVGIAVDSSGNAYITGETSSTDFPTTPGAFQTSCASCSFSGGGSDAFVSKLNPTGTALVYSTYMGGTTPFPGACDCNTGGGIAVDSSGAAYITGDTASTNFPTTAGAYQTAYAGANADAFMTKLNASGSALVYSSYFGGNDYDVGVAIALDATGDAFISGLTASTNLPTTAGAYRTTYAGGSFDAFVTKVNAAGSNLSYSTYLGGSGTDFGNGIAVDAGGRAYVTGFANSTNFPTTSDAVQATSGGDYDAFLSQLTTTGALAYSTYLGGTGVDEGIGVAVDASGNAYVAGSTASTNFATTDGAYQTTCGSCSRGNGNAFVTKLGIAGTPPTPAKLALSPSAGVGTVGGTATFTASVSDAGDNPLTAITVRFSVTGAVATSGSCVTAADGRCSFSYAGPQLPGADAITAYADTNTSGSQDAGEPGDEATQAWTVPASTPGQVTGGGQIPNSSGQSKVAFGFTAKSDSSGSKGECTAVDISPQTNITIKCTSVTTLVETGTAATFFGNATVNGAPTTYRIDVQDNAEPGAASDTFAIQTASGYTAGGTLSKGNIQVHP